MLIQIGRHDRGFVVDVAMLVVTVLAVGAGVYVPIAIDDGARRREVTRICTEAVLDLRASMDDLSTGYAVAGSKASERMADWDRGRYAIERTRVSCRNITLPTAGNTSAKTALWNQYQTEQNLARDGDTPLTVVAAVRRWTTDAVLDLTTPN